jgi:long-chain acyl-CoA synthetase
MCTCQCNLHVLFICSVYDKVMAGVAASPPMKKGLFHIALDSKTWYLQQGGHVTHPIYDRLVFSKLRELMGGRVRLMITGSAPISSAVKDFLQVAFCAPVLEGYGLSETVGIVTISPVQARSLPGVGCPVTCNEIKLADIPEMGYLHTDKPHPRGEICMRGPNIFLGYYKAPALTAEAIDADGWFHSGDVGRITEEGTLIIFDRKKNIFKLSQGEYVAPEKIENVYQRSAFVAQAFVHGDSLMSSLVGIIVPDPDTVAQWATTAGVPFDMTALCRTNAAFRKAVEDSMVAAAKAGGLKGFECVKTFFLEPNPFSVENDLLTPTFKLKRHQLKGRYAAEIHDMYKSLGEV